MKKLTIEHLAAYLPYGVKVVPIFGGYAILDVENIGRVLESDKPLKICLRPLSDITKPITHNGETFEPAERIDPVLRLVHNKYVNDWDAVGWMDVESWPYPLVKQLHSWHFDTFGLGADNLCVYMNPDGTLTK